MSAKANQPADRSGDFGASGARVGTAVGAIVGLVLMLVGLIVGLRDGWGTMHFLPAYIEGLGVLAVAFFVFFNMEWLAKVISGRAALSGLLVAVMCTAAVVLWVAGVYFFTYRGLVSFRGRSVPLYKSWDMTKTGRFTLSEATLKQLGELKQPLKLVVVGLKLDYQRPDADNLLALYKAARPDKVELEYLAPNDPKFSVKHKNLADRVKREQEELGYGTLAVLYGDKDSRVIRSQEFWDYREKPWGGQVASDQFFKGEDVVSSAILQMLDDKKPKAYFVWGHGERDMEARQANGMSLAVELLSRENVETARLQLASVQKVPDDASLVVVCGPRKAFSEGELDVLQKYVAESKGRLLICLDEFRPESDVGLEPLLAGFGIAAGRDVLVEPDPQHSISSSADIKFSADFGSHPIVERLAAVKLPVFFRLARTVRGAEESEGPWKVDVLVSGSPDSYGETDVEAWYNRGQAKYDEGRDGPKPAGYAVVSWAGSRGRTMPGMPPMEPPDLGRVMVVGDSDWCSNEFLRKGPGNAAFFSLAVQWLVGQEKRMGIPSRQVEDEQLSLTPAQNSVAYTILISAPALLALVAIIVAWLRRR